MKDIFVLDTNTLISAALFPNSVPAKVFTKAKDLGILAVSTATINEIKEVIKRPKFEKYVAIEKRLLFIDEYKIAAILFQPTITITDCRDLDDNKFLELALTANASCIVSGDSDLLVLHPFKDIPILTPADFLLHDFI